MPDKRPARQENDSDLTQSAVAQPETSVDLLRRAQGGEDAAVNRLLARYLPPFRAWASRRLPPSVRDFVDTDDLVQDTLLRTFTHLRGFQPRGDGALQAYLRQALRNRIRDELRRRQRQGRPVTFPSKEPDRRPSPEAAAIDVEEIERYEAALDRLDDADHQAIVARFELGQEWSRVATVLGKPSPDAARMAVGRAVKKLAEEMARESRKEPT